MTDARALGDYIAERLKEDSKRQVSRSTGISTATVYNLAYQLNTPSEPTALKLALYWGFGSYQELVEEAKRWRQGR